MKKLTDFTHFEQKNTYISGCKIMHKCIIATVIVHICTATVACAFNILIISDSLLFFSLFFICKTNPPSHVLSSSDTTHSHRHKIKNQLQKSKINHKINKKKKNQPQNQQKKSTTGTKSLDRWCWWKSVMGWCWSVLMEIDDGLTKINVDGDRCWWSACNGLMEKRKEKDS